MNSRERERLARVEQKVADMEPWLREIDEKLDRLIAAANMGQGAWLAALKLGGLLVLATGAVAWLYDRVRP
ncbi:MAG TPA: hypothetical protein VMV26_19125 [Alphaproteobacteria bacterium]|nr:hypothetical protein [Alphaproteobacteria bacterium]